MYEKMDRCSKVNLTIPFITNFQTKTISVSVSLSDSKFKDCFTYFEISLKNRRVANASMLPFNYDINKIVSYTFQSVGCGVYELDILPCYNNWQCQQPPFRIKNINMTSADCLGMRSKPHKNKMHSQDLENKVLLIVAVVAITLLILIGLSYHKLATLKSKKEKKLCIEDGIEIFRDHEVVLNHIQVFIINHYNDATIQRVELLKDFMSHCPNLSVILIEDGLAVSLITGSDWLDSMLQRTGENDKVMKKIIIVDSIEQMEAEENEIENATFYEAIKKLSHDWLRSLDDYDNLFVVYFNSSLKERGCVSRFRLKELDYIVKRVRYSIPDDLINLCLNLISVTEFDTHGIEEKLRNILSHHDIRNLGVSLSSMWLILHGGELHSYHLQCVQDLSTSDYQQHLDFAHWFLQLNAVVLNFAANIFFTDEAIFILEGICNMHNVHVWAHESPKAIQPHAAQFRCSINICAGLFGDNVICPYMLPSILNDETYKRKIIGILKL